MHANAGTSVVDAIHTTAGTAEDLLVLMQQPLDNLMVAKESPMTNTEMASLSPLAPHISRSDQVTQLHDLSKSTNLIFVEAPYGAGKTSLFELFRHHYASTVSCHYVDMDNDERTAQQIFSSTLGIDMDNQLNRILPNSPLLVDNTKKHVVFLDNCHTKYDDVSFWRLLVKNGHSWLPKAKLTFIIAAEKGDAYPIYLNSLVGLGASDLAFGREESLAMLMLPYPTGLHESLRKPEFMNRVITDCNGHAKSLRLVINQCNEAFQDATPTEQELLTYFLSSQLQLYGCFPVLPEQLTQASNDCLIHLITRQRINKSNCDADSLKLLEKANIVQEEGGVVKFSSPLAARYAGELIARMPAL